MESLEALQPLCLDAHFMAIIMTFLIGQHVQLDIILPPFGGRPPSASTERPHPQASLVMGYLNKFQGCWPMPVTGRAVDRFRIRLTFCHLLMAPLARLGSVSRFRMEMSLRRAQQLAHITLRAPRGLPRAYALVDSIVWHDSESEYHAQTDAEILCTLQCHFARSPC